MVEGSAAMWLSASGLELLDVVDDGVELVVAVRTTATVVGCAECGVRATLKDRRWVTLPDAPSGDRAVRLRWRKRSGRVSTSTATCAPGPSRRAWPRPAGCSPHQPASGRPTAWPPEGTTASIAQSFAVSWSTVWSAVERNGRSGIDDAERVRPLSIAGSMRRSCSRRAGGAGLGSYPPWSTWPSATCSTCSKADMPANYGSGWPISRRRGLPWVQVVSVDPLQRAGYRAAVCVPTRSPSGPARSPMWPW